MTVAIFARLCVCVCVCVRANCMFEWQCISSLYCDGNKLKQVDDLSLQSTISNVHRLSLSSTKSIACLSCLSYVPAVSMAIVKK